jgi:hypothetical protein
MNCPDISSAVNDLLISQEGNVSGDYVERVYHIQYTGVYQILVCAVMDYMDVHDIKVEGGGEQDIRFFKRKVEAVLLELFADERLDS